MFWWLLSFGWVAQSGPMSVSGPAMVVSDHQAASKAGAWVMDQGGNAVDAAVASALAAGVVQPAGSGLGGGGFALVVLPGGEATVLDFREVAPAGAHETMFQEPSGVVSVGASRIGGLAVGVPGEARGLAELSRRFGELSPRLLARPSRRLARGHLPSIRLLNALESTSYSQVLDLFSADGVPVEPNRPLRRPDIARTLKRWALSEGEDLYTGRIAEAIVAATEAHGGVLTEADMAAYAVVEREPLRGTFREYTVLTMPPPSSGGLVLLQALQVLESVDLESLGHNSSAYIHRVVEALKHGFADRAHHMGDPDFVEVPVARLLSTARVEEIRGAFLDDKTLPNEAYGQPVSPLQDAGTQHISVLDAEGGAVALTTTINTSFGSGVVVEGTGIVLNNEMDDFVAAPGVPNAYGLIGNAANAIQAGKRPLSSMSPTVVLNADGDVVLVAGASGGSHIISATLQVILSVLAFEMDPQEAVAATRFHHQWQPETLWIEPSVPMDVREGLMARGHELYVAHDYASVQVIVRGSETLRGGADPRKGGWPAASYAVEH